MSGVYCACRKPNTRQTAFARANRFSCPECERTLHPDPSAETNGQQPNIELTGRQLSPDSHPGSQPTIQSTRGLTPSPSRLPTHNRQPGPNGTRTHITIQWSTPPLTRHPPQTQPRAPQRIIRTPDNSDHRQRRHNLGNTRRRLWSTHDTEDRTH